MMHLEFGMASQYSRDLSVNVKRGNKKRLEEGWWNGPAPLGYLNNSDKYGDPIINDPNRFHLVQKMWNLMLTGQYTVPQLLKIVNEEWRFRTHQRGKTGGKSVSRSGLYGVFNNPFYYGFMKRGNIEAWGKHTPMITKEEFDIVQKRLGRFGVSRAQKKSFAFRGMIKCGACGYTIIPEHTLNRHQKLYTYYHCDKRLKKVHAKKCTQKSIRLENLENQIIDALGKIEIPDDFKHWAIEYLNQVNDTEIKDRKQHYHQTEKQYRSFQDDIDKLTRMRLRELINDEEYLREKSVLLKEKQRLKEILDGVEHRANTWLELSIKTFEFAKNAKTWFKQASLSEKTEILSAIGSEFVLQDRQLEIHWSRPFEIIKENIEGIKQSPKVLEPYMFKLKNREPSQNNNFPLNKMLEPSKISRNQTQKDSILMSDSEVNPVWRRRPDSNRRPPA